MNDRNRANYITFCVILFEKSNFTRKRKSAECQNIRCIWFPYVYKYLTEDSREVDEEGNDDFGNDEAIYWYTYKILSLPLEDNYNGFSLFLVSK